MHKLHATNRTIIEIKYKCPFDSWRKISVDDVYMYDDRIEIRSWGIGLNLLVRDAKQELFLVVVCLSSLSIRPYTDRSRVYKKIPILQYEGKYSCGDTIKYGADFHHKTNSKAWLTLNKIGSQT
jgi:hypothetical protein